MYCNAPGYNVFNKIYQPLWTMDFKIFLGIYVSMPYFILQQEKGGDIFPQPPPAQIQHQQQWHPLTSPSIPFGEGSKHVREFMGKFGCVPGSLGEVHR